MIAGLKVKHFSRPTFNTAEILPINMSKMTDAKFKNKLMNACTVN